MAGLGGLGDAAPPVFVFGTELCDKAERSKPPHLLVFVFGEADPPVFVFGTELCDKAERPKRPTFFGRRKRKELLRRND